MIPASIIKLRLLKNVPHIKEAFRHLDDIEAVMGGSNGPSIQLRAQIADLGMQLAAAKEDASYAWRNVRILEAARQEEMNKRDEAKPDQLSRGQKW